MWKHQSSIAQYWLTVACNRPKVTGCMLMVKYVDCLMHHYIKTEAGILILQTRNNAGGIIQTGFSFRLAATLEPSHFFRPSWTQMFPTTWMNRGLTKWSAVFQGQLFEPRQDTAFFFFFSRTDPELKDFIVIMCFWLECVERHLFKAPWNH